MSHTATRSSAKGTTYEVRLDGKVVGARTSKREYRAAVVVATGKRVGVFAYAGNAQLASARLTEVRGAYPTEDIIIAQWAEPATPEPKADAKPAPAPKPTPKAAQPTKPAKAKADAATSTEPMPECPRKHTAEGAKARRAAYYQRNGHFKPTHVKADQAAA